MAASLLSTGDEKEIITYYFSRGYEYDAIVHFLAKFHDITMSIRTLKNRLRRYQLRRRTPTCDLNLVREGILRELSGPGCSGGDRSMWHILHLHNIQVPRHVVVLEWYRSFLVVDRRMLVNCKRARAKRANLIFVVLNMQICDFVDVVVMLFSAS